MIAIIQSVAGASIGALVYFLVPFLHFYFCLICSVYYIINYFVFELNSGLYSIESADAKSKGEKRQTKQNSSISSAFGS